MPTVPASFGPMIDEYMAKTGQTSDRMKGNCPITSSMAEAAKDPETKPGKRDYVIQSFKQPGIWTIPVWLCSEANAGGKMRAAIARKGTVKNAIWRALGPGWRIFGPIGESVRNAAGNAGKQASLPSIRVIRLGGRGLDTGNLWRAIKPVEDAIAVLLGCDDGWQAWKDSFQVDQEPGPLWGCRIELLMPEETGPAVR